jgi:ribosomal protein S17E
MKNGLARFEFHLKTLELLLIKASKQKNTALWLYKNNARTPLFMLQGLAKMYAGLHNKKKFTKLKEHFKLLEDGLGSIDYYDNFAKQFATNKKIPAEVTKYLQEQTNVKINQLNELLKENKWLGAKPQRVVKIKEKLREAAWLTPTEEVKAMSTFYKKAIDDIITFVNENNFVFTDVENDIHELRRKLRWLSIYPQALKGAIQFDDNRKKVSSVLKKYHTKEILQSPFNKLPKDTFQINTLILNQNYFYALSWMIAELGKLKDSGLGIIAIKEALEQNAGLSNEVAINKAYELLGTKQSKLSNLLNDAETICKIFFKEKNLQNLVVGGVSIQWQATTPNK